jgi:hypothetical protein
LSDILFSDIKLSPSSIIAVKEGSELSLLKLENVTFRNIEGAGGCMNIEFGKGEFIASNTTFECNTSPGGFAECVYFKVNSDSSEQFIFDNITLKYTIAIEKPILFIEYPSEINIVETDESIKEFRKHFKNFPDCSSRDDTIFIVKNIATNENYSIFYFLCEVSMCEFITIMLLSC